MMLPREAFKLQEKLSSTKVHDNLDIETILSFHVKDALCGISFESIFEVVDYYPYKSYPIPVEGHYGIINLRGNIVPIINPFNDLVEGDHEKKYLFLQDAKEYKIGIIVTKVKKLEIEKEKIISVMDNKVLNHNDKPLRFLTIDGILKNYKNLEDEKER